MFHSAGTVQSKTRVPVGISLTSSGIGSSTISSVRRTPSPVMLRHSGYSRSTRACIRSPTASRECDTVLLLWGKCHIVSGLADGLSGPGGLADGLSEPAGGLSGLGGLIGLIG